ncbi:hypothetical protein Q8F55_008454 [Vanrija albida]|uniref:Amino acid permease/ SLC12A domain-containing protein n=1 Tax=Vanrija albida TaxID=181172 RepID=A0ABR3PQV7_9TREE
MSHTTPPEDSPYLYDDKKNHEGGVAIVEIGHPDDDLATTHFGEHGIRRDLPPRVVSMIAIAGTIGTGLFLGSGGALVKGGPVGMWLGYTMMGAAVGMMMTTLGEMSCFNPNVGGFIEMTTKYFDPALGFMCGVNYILQAGFGIPTELAAIAILFSYWDTNSKHAAIYIIVFLILTVAVNIIGVKWYGEIEFVFACLKVAMLVGLMLFGLIADLGGIPPKHEFIGGRYWREEPFNDNFRGVKPVELSRFLGFWGVFTQAAFSYSAIESVASLAGEAHNPRKTLRMAIRTVFYRIAGIYVLATLIIGLVVSQNSPDLKSAMANGHGTAGASPFVVVAKQMQVKVLPHIVNAVVITSALSSGNEQTYAFARSLMAMARNGQAPKIFLSTSKLGIPWAGVALSAVFACLGFLSAGSSGAAQAFTWLQNLSALSCLVSWASICLAYTRFMKACKLQGVDRKKFVFRGYGQPYMAWFCFVFFTIVLVFNGFAAFIPTFNVSDFFASYVTVPVVLISFVGWKIAKKTKMPRLEDIDLSAGPKEALVGTRYDPNSPEYDGRYA